ncbi:AAA family ATPase [Azospirillum sp.]|uniref:AAA family ATPase n=1 Tax=Azospirillum sp. TaxID=34012 RepID=UPI002D3364A5|nr:AAA family ATPase [Azospirillum sp.]HYD65292.1 AAA family ATPase [Azospirillum sp.]
MDANDPGTPPPIPQDPPESPQESSPLLLPSLRIENFRGFKELTIPKLGRVNLIVGKNGVGKSSLLEALHLYFTDGAPEAIQDIFDRRDEYRPRAINGLSGTGTAPARIKYLVENIFHGRPKISNIDHPISIGPYSRESLHIRFSKEGLLGEYEMSTGKMTNRESERFTINAQPSLVISRDIREIREFILTDDNKGFPVLTIINIDEDTLTKDSCTNIPQSGLSNSQAAAMWDRVSLTDLEDEVISAIKILTKEIQRLGVIGDAADIGGRRFVARVDGMSMPLPLKELGDGTVRTLGLALALACQPDRAILIDELENGLHWSVQSKVWEIVFTLAERLNVQVFATTHSYDCIEAFQQAASRSREPAYLIRLDNRGPELKAVSITGDELAYITREKIEVR